MNVYKNLAEGLTELLQEYGIDIKVIRRSTAYYYNKGVSIEGNERYFKRWEDVAEFLKGMTWGYNFCRDQQEEKKAGK